VQATPLSPADLLFIAAAAIGLLLIPLGLPGLWIIVGAAFLHRFAGDPHELGFLTLAAIAALALLAEVVESLLGVLTARRFGATKWGMWGAFLGGIAGAIVFSPVLPLVGTLVGAFVGSFVGAFALEWKQSRAFRAGWRAGLGAFVGRIAAVALKTVIGISIVVLVVWNIGR
jgi:uncharacterized protein YqgC (DUF456 family)